MENEVCAQTTNFSKICLFFMYLVFSCLVLAGWLWFRQHPWAISILFAVH